MGGPEADVGFPFVAGFNQSAYFGEGRKRWLFRVKNQHRIPKGK